MKVLFFNNKGEMELKKGSDKNIGEELSKVLSVLEKTLPLKKINDEDPRRNTTH